jgi:hypothetical protein
MGERARARVAERFSLAACVDGYARLYAGLLAGPGTPASVLLEEASTAGPVVIG